MIGRITGNEIPANKVLQRLKIVGGDSKLIAAARLNRCEAPVRDCGGSLKLAYGGKRHDRPKHSANCTPKLHP